MNIWFLYVSLTDLTLNLSNWVLYYDRRFLLLSDSYGFVDVGRSLYDERTGLSFTIAAGLRERGYFESESRGTRDHILLSQIRDFPFVASYDSHGYGGGIRPRLHKGFSRIHECAAFYNC
jgi:hypothetical protein